MTSPVDKAELPKLPENQKSYAGIPEAVFVVSSIEITDDLSRLHNLKTKLLIFVGDSHSFHKKNHWQKPKFSLTEIFCHIHRMMSMHSWCWRRMTAMPIWFCVN